MEKVSRQKLVEQEQAIAEWESRAEKAVRAGDDDLAREALKRKGDSEGAKERAERTLAEQTAYADQLTQALKQLEERLREVKARKETLKAKARASKGQSPLGSSAFNEFERLAGKIDVVEAEAEVDEELRANLHEDAKSREAEKKLDNLGKDRELEDRLAALKEKLKKP
jgi:phage shock protein A